MENKFNSTSFGPHLTIDLSGCNKVYNRIPHEYFITKGSGESDFEIHAGSYHVALYDAKICNYNIQTYSSILPEASREININDINIPFGSELYTIMSCIHGNKGEYLNCGIIIGDLIHEGKKTGSLVCEVSNKGNLNIRKQLEMAIIDLQYNTYKDFELKNFKYITNNMTVGKKFGTCLVSLCFYSFLSF